MCVLNRAKYEGHCVRVIRQDINLGICQSRNFIIEKDYFENPLSCRLDDDVIIEPDYLEKLLRVIDAGYDIASGVTPLMIHPEHKRTLTKIDKIFNKKEFDKEGKLIKNNDDCGFAYIGNTDKIYPAQEFRSCAMIKREVTDKVKYETNLSPTGFREEGFFSLRALWMGFKIGIMPSAIAYHIQCSMGGVRSPDYGQRVQSDNAHFESWIQEMYKEKGKWKNSEKEITN